MADDPQLYRNGYSSADRNLIAADNLVTSIRRMVGSTTRSGQRTLLEHAAMQAADEIERLRAAGDALATQLRWWIDGTDEAYPDHQTLADWLEIRRA